MNFKEQLKNSFHLLVKNKKRFILSTFFISLNLSLYGYASYCFSFDKSSVVYQTLKSQDIPVLDLKKHKQIKSTYTTMLYETISNDDISSLSKEVGSSDLYGVPYSMKSSIKTLPYQDGFKIKGTAPIEKQDVLISKAKLRQFQEEGFYDSIERKHLYPSDVTEESIIGNHISLTKDGVGDMFVIKGICEDDSLDEKTYVISDSYYHDYQEGKGTYYLGTELFLQTQNRDFKINGNEELISVSFLNSSHDIEYFKKSASLEDNQVLVSPQAFLSVLRDESDETCLVKVKDSITIDFDETDLSLKEESGFSNRFDDSFKIYPEYFLDSDYLEDKIINLSMFNIAYGLIDDCMENHSSELKGNLNDKENIDSDFDSYRNGTNSEKKQAKMNLSFFLSELLKKSYLGEQNKERFSFYDEEAYNSFCSFYTKYQQKEKNALKAHFKALYESRTTKDLTFQLTQYENGKTKEIIGVDYDLSDRSIALSQSGVSKIIEKIEYSSVVTLNDTKEKLKKISDINARHNNKVYTFLIFIYSNNEVGDYYILQDDASLEMNQIEASLIIGGKVLLIIALLLTIYSVIAAKEFMKKTILESIDELKDKTENDEKAFGVYHLTLIEFSLSILILSYLLVLFIGSLTTGIFKTRTLMSVSYLASFAVPILTLLVLVILFVYLTSLLKIMKITMKNA